MPISLTDEARQLRARFRVGLGAEVVLAPVGTCELATPRAIWALHDGTLDVSALAITRHAMSWLFAIQFDAPHAAGSADR